MAWKEKVEQESSLRFPTLSSGCWRSLGARKSALMFTRPTLWPRSKRRTLASPMPGCALVGTTSEHCPQAAASCVNQVDCLTTPDRCQSLRGSRGPERLCDPQEATQPVSAMEPKLPSPQPSFLALAGSRSPVRGSFENLPLPRPLTQPALWVSLELTRAMQFADRRVQGPDFLHSQLLS